MVFKKKEVEIDTNIDVPEMEEKKVVTEPPAPQDKQHKEEQDNDEVTIGYVLEEIEKRLQEIESKLKEHKHNEKGEGYLPL